MSTTYIYIHYKLFDVHIYIYYIYILSALRAAHLVDTVLIVASCCIFIHFLIRLGNDTFNKGDYAAAVEFYTEVGR